MTRERTLAMGVIRRVVALLTVVDQGSHILQVITVLGNGTGDQLACLRRCERRTFF